ncbi:MAG: TadE family protein [Gemmataceae bacterium]|nr:TadE family protein [Gemmataceae bacterium]
MRLSRGKGRSGVTTVEMAIVGPIALILIIGIMDIGLAVWSYNNISEAVREGGRYAQIHGSKYAAWAATQPAGTTPASGPAANDANVDKVVRSYSFVSQSNLTVTSSWPNGDNHPNSPVTIDATYTYSPTLIFGLGTLTLKTSSTMYINY